MLILKRKYQTNSYQVYKSVDKLNEESVKIVIQLINQRISLGLGNDELINTTLVKADTDDRMSQTHVLNKNTDVLITCKNYC